MRTRSVRILIGVLATLAVLLAACAPAAAPPPPKAAEPKPAEPKAVAQPTTLKFALAYPSANSLPIYAAMDKGFLKQENIDLDVMFISTGDKMFAALIGGSLEVAMYTPDTAMRAIESGEKLTIFLGGVNIPLYSLVTPKTVKTYNDLKGKLIAVSTVSSGDAFFTRKMMGANGLTDGKDYDLVQVGGTPERSAALKSGSVAAALLGPPQDQQIIDEGYNRLDTTTNTIKAYAWDTPVVRKDWAEKNESVLVALTRGFIKGFRWVYDPKNAGDAISIVQQRLKLEEKYAKQVYEAFVNAAVWDKDAAINVKGLQANIDAMAERGELKAPLPKVEKYINSTYWEKAIKTLQ
ncbi:MAG: ABC transporter substrate-binding protein [Chloroflexi bacterium]|nr:ABC transporter substrate-binding protein [Chloroflexota bacterium]